MPGIDLDSLQQGQQTRFKPSTTARNCSGLKPPDILISTGQQPPQNLASYVYAAAFPSWAASSGELASVYRFPVHGERGNHTCTEHTDGRSLLRPGAVWKSHLHRQFSPPFFVPCSGRDGCVESVIASDHTLEIHHCTYCQRSHSCLHRSAAATDGHHGSLVDGSVIHACMGSYPAHARGILDVDG